MDADAWGRVSRCGATLLRPGRATFAALALAGVTWAGVTWAGGSPGRPAAPSRGEVETLRVPEGGRMPRAVVDAEGTVHLVYVGGGTDRTNLLHATRVPGSLGWSEPQRVNGRDLSVAGVGPVDGAQLALGPDDRLHVVWLQPEPARFVYTRSRAEGSGFEPQRELSTGNDGNLEAGPAVAVDGGGNVFVFWHAGAGEDARRSVFLTASGDGGTTFEPAGRVGPDAEGACACCGLSALSDRDGAVHVFSTSHRSTSSRAAAWTASWLKPRHPTVSETGSRHGCVGVVSAGYRARNCSAARRSVSASDHSLAAARRLMSR